MALLAAEPGGAPRLMARPRSQSVARIPSALSEKPTACPPSLMPFARLNAPPGRVPRSRISPPSQRNAWAPGWPNAWPGPVVESPTTCPRPFIRTARLSSPPGRVPRSRSTPRSHRKACSVPAGVSAPPATAPSGLSALALPLVGPPSVPRSVTA